MSIRDGYETEVLKVQTVASAVINNRVPQPFYFYSVSVLGCLGNIFYLI